MATASLDICPTPSPAPPLTSESSDALGERIAALAAHLHAATYELLVLLRQFDDSTGWHGVFASTAHWLHSTPARRPRAPGAPAWRTGIALRAAREKVRVAHALVALPRVSATMARGAISYAKVRALTRVATPANEPRCSTSPRPAPRPTSNVWSGPGGASIGWRRREPKRGICTGSCRPGSTTTAWS